MPEGEEHNGLDREKLEHGVVGREEVFGGRVEQEEAVEGDGDRDVVGYAAVEVACSRAGGGRQEGSQRQDGGLKYIYTHSSIHKL